MNIVRHYLYNAKFEPGTSLTTPDTMLDHILFLPSNKLSHLQDWHNLAVQHPEEQQRQSYYFPLAAQIRALHVWTIQSALAPWLAHQLLSVFLPSPIRVADLDLCHRATLACPSAHATDILG